jgi:hypothetical protein
MEAEGEQTQPASDWPRTNLLNLQHHRSLQRRMSPSPLNLGDSAEDMLEIPLALASFRQE